VEDLAKFGLLAFSLLYGARYIACVIWQKSISEMHAWMMALSIAGFITLQWLV
jgi:hypothetical protein